MGEERNWRKALLICKDSPHYHNPHAAMLLPNMKGPGQRPATVLVAEICLDAERSWKISCVHKSLFLKSLNRF